MALTENRYGKSNVRMLKVAPDRRTVREVSVDITVEGDFGAAHTSGDNTEVLPTDTMKNTVYALGRDHPLDTIEAFALHLARYIHGHNPSVHTAHVTIASPAWRPLDTGGTTHPEAFRRDAGDTETCEVTVSDDGIEVAGGLRDLVILKTTHSGFSNFRCDAYTTLADTADRLLGTSLTAAWPYVSSDVDFAGARETVRRALLDTFATHESLSVQHTLYAMAEAALAATPSISRIKLTMPNRHNLLVDLAPFGLSNDNEIFLPIDEPSGLIEAVVER